IAGCSALPWEDDAEGAPAALTSCGSNTDEVPQELSCTGLYADFTKKAVAPNARAYAPAVPLWSDGYEKDRFIMLPDGAKIDATNIDDWRFPVGTKAWKEFRHGAHKIETRFFWKAKDDHWLSASYVWSEDGTKATRGDGTDLTVDGKPYHVPKTTECDQCHRGRKD